MPKITIDYKEMHVSEGLTVIQAAEQAGIDIPHYCYHPGLPIAGNCRMCLVEMEGAPKLIIACATQVQEGMVIRTDNERVLKAREAIMEFLLIHHPLDCPICDQAGECRLQQYSVEHGRGESRYSEPKQALAKAVDIGPHVMLDQDRCIRCSRCVRFCRDVTGTGELAFFKRGEKSQIGLFPGKRLDNPYSGNVVDICPVGALTLKEFRFQARVWFLEDHPSVCVACARGCNIDVSVHAYDHYQVQKIRRITPRHNERVNGHWICDAGRLSYQRLDAADRLKVDDWDETVVRAAAVFKASAAAGRAAAILSPRLTNETMYAWRTLFERFGKVKAGVPRLLEGEDDDLLIRADKGGNSTGAEWLFGPHATEETVLESIRCGEADTLLVVADPLDPAGTAPVGNAERSQLKNIIYIGPFSDGPASSASVVIPAAAWSEEDGTVVNFKGRVQQVKRCTISRNEARPGWRIACDMAASAGEDLPDWTSAADILLAMAETVPQFKGMDIASVGELGMMGKPGEPVEKQG